MTYCEQRDVLYCGRYVVGDNCIYCGADVHECYILYNRSVPSTGLLRPVPVD